MKSFNIDRSQTLLLNRISFEKLTMIIEGVPRVIGANILLGLLFVFALENEYSSSSLWSWFELNFILMLARLSHFIYFKRNKNRIDYAKHYYLALIGLAFTALLWASTALFFFPVSGELRLFLVICIAGLASGALGSNSAIFVFYSTYVILLVVPFVTIFILQESKISYFIAASLFFYVIFVLIISKKMSKDLDLTLHVGYKNDSLVEKLKLVAEQAKAGSEAKSTFLSNMSHEIRTPLNAILGFIDLLKEKTKDKTSTEYLNIIDSSSKSLLNIIEDILDFSKIESGKLEIDKIDFHTRAEFEVITYLFDAKCSEKDITLILNIDENVPKYLNTDPHRVKQIISNLLSNAVKFTDKGKSISVTINYKDKFLNIAIKDEGKGIAKEKQEHIFSAFEQEDSSTTREYGGSGLGLSISTQLTELLGGELKLKSELGVGSEFFFSIPVEIGQELKVETIINGEIALSGYLLLVEDNKTNQLLMKIVLDEIGLEYDVANDGLEAIQMFRDNQYDAILMDENMPHMGGMEATSKILEIEKLNSLEHTPIIALTANALQGDRERFLAAGMDDYLSKPVDKNRLCQVLSKYLDKKLID